MGGIAPGVVPTDVLDACALHEVPAGSELANICVQEQLRAEQHNDIGLFYRGAGALELAARLNELYGIP